ncbi:tetratricopeptide repeat protein [Moraxella sp. ZJ142]|uniref:tetratricopeptide repeat protein n=1 Tax=Moraxella marmotae TaxID=3344520 RepID=UPI0035D413E4
MKKLFALLSLAAAVFAQPVLADWQPSAELLALDAEQIAQKAMAGDADAQLMVAIAFIEEESEMSFDAKEWIEKAAKQGQPVAEMFLGMMYFDGSVIRQSNTEALRYLTSAANKGESVAQYYLGEMYYYGQGVKQDYAKARTWYQKSAAQDDEDAQYSLGVMHEYGQGVAKNLKAAKSWYGKACDNGSKDGCLGYKTLKQQGY